ncbi:MAG: hypothetical protein A2140_00300 [Candidatus Muproteobacteria bacterium RBG_16_62_13]|uniref:MSHA biogenesis protein MshK n=1 Tax=Candidatus Muproteobacteria bacterium RBG_16_62_13 TaxID=1817756 RepID=A0A1F6T762_9PROT|nr:MAG: hypothetical protein A2140_00300 [Candidatus Muproteobacteria bacterium RBG_16_62_13]
MIRMVGGFSLLLAAGLAGAEVFDPTRPYTGHADTVAPGTGSLLQSTMMSPAGHRAVIAGQTYRVGEKYGQELLVAIRPYEVVLRKPDGSERVLRMLPKLPKTVNKDNKP